MLVILDTNILISALLEGSSPPALLYEAWKEGRFALVTSDAQLEEFSRATRYPRVRRLISPSDAGSMINHIRGLALVLGRLPLADVSADPGATSCSLWRGNQRPIT